MVWFISAFPAGRYSASTHCWVSDSAGENTSAIQTGKGMARISPVSTFLCIQAESAPNASALASLRLLPASAMSPTRRSLCSSRALSGWSTTHGADLSIAGFQVMPATRRKLRSSASGRANPLPAMSIALPWPVLASSTSAPIETALAAFGATSLTGMWPWSCSMAT